MYALAPFAYWYYFLVSMVHLKRSKINPNPKYKLIPQHTRLAGLVRGDQPHPEEDGLAHHDEPLLQHHQTAP
jgi:hypothetical protein